MLMWCPVKAIKDETPTSKCRFDDMTEQNFRSTTQCSSSLLREDLFEELVGSVCNLEENREFIILKKSNYHVVCVLKVFYIILILLNWQQISIVVCYQIT